MTFQITYAHFSLKISRFSIAKNLAITGLLSFFCALSFNTAAQFSDDFSSGSLMTNGWVGNSEKFTVNVAEELQLSDQDPASANSSSLMVPVQTGDSTQWSFQFRYDFSPSTSNYANVILAADGTDFENYNGYFLKLGGANGSVDAIELFRKDGSNEVKIIEGPASTLGDATISASVRITRNDSNFWTLEMDNTGGTNYQFQGSVIDDTYPVGFHFGLTCIYSTTRADKIFFDNFLIGPEFIDNIKPVVNSLIVIDDNTVELSFNEALENGSATNFTNYELTPNIALDDVNNPVSNTVQLDFSDSFVSGQSYTLSIQNVGDVAGNIISDTTLTFEFLLVEPVAPYDLLITEILADPSPSVGLPEVEYLELYNRSEKNIQLNEIILADANTEVVLEDYILEPDSYVLLYKTEPGIIYETLPNHLALGSFPGLGNEGDQINISNAAGDVIHAVSYSNDWYQNADRDDGGYSLELINIEEPCLLMENWAASSALVGGTPGGQNANFNSANIDVDLEISNIITSGNNSVLFRLNQSLSLAVLDQIDLFTIDGFVAENIQSVSDQTNEFEIFFNNNFEVDQVYEFCIDAATESCNGEAFTKSTCSKFGIPVLPEVGDIFINEILFNPETGGNDYVELINASEHIFDLSKLFLASLDTLGNLFQVNSLSNGFLFLPGDLVVLTESPSDVQNRYTVPKPNNLIQMDVPTYDDREGHVILLLQNFPDQLLLDQVDYSQDWHNALLDNRDGVSLERLSAMLDSNSPDNWRSASAAVGFGTPTGTNSQMAIETPPGSNPFTIGKNVFSPNDDGNDDFLAIEYQEGTEDFLLNLRIYDISGRLVKTIANNYSGGSRAFFRWDGDDEDGMRARMGIYILWMERFSPGGTVERFKENVVVAENLN